MPHPRSTPLSLAFAGLIAAGLAGLSPAAAAQQMQRVPVIDQNGFERPMTAMTLEVPQGWRAQGGLRWNPQAACGLNQVYDWQAQSPDGRHGAQLLPMAAWSDDNLGFDEIPRPCPKKKIHTVRDYLVDLVQRLRPNARLLDFRPRQDLVRGAPPPGDANTRTWKEGGEVLVSWPSPAGEVRESISVVVQFQHMRMPGVMPGEVREFFSALANPALAVRAPAGQLDMRLPTHLAMSLQPDPQWQARMDRQNTALARQGLQGQIARGGIGAQTIQDIGAIHSAGVAARDARGDAMHRDTIDGITNVDRYTDPVTGDEVQMDNRYDHAWRAADGTYFQSNDPNLNPYVDLGIEAEEMERNE